MLIVEDYLISLSAM